MEKIVEIFEDFINLTQTYEEFDLIELNSLKEEMQCLTPLLPLPLTDPSFSFLNMPAVIIVNFLKYAQATIHKFGLDTLKRIISKNVEEENTKVQLMLMVHVSKLSIPNPATVYKYVESTTCSMQIDEVVESWVAIANKLLEHLEIASVIEELMKQTFGDAYSQRVTTGSVTKYSAKIIRSGESALRGFAGIDTVYINENHFKPKALSLSLYPQGTPEEKENVVLIDIATVCLHELAYIKIREAFDNFNFSTPTFMVTSDENEFGRITEKHIFGMVIDWKKSFEGRGLSADYVKKFLTALEENSALPLISPGRSLVDRSSSTIDHGTGGVDFLYDSDVFIE